MKAAKTLYPLSAAMLLASVAGCQETDTDRDYGFRRGSSPAVVTSARPARPQVIPAPPAPRTATYIGAVSAPVTYLPAATVPAGRRLATLYRYAGQYDEYFVRGDAAVSASPVFEGGVRLAAWDGQNEQETSRVAVATAVYFFSIPPEARALSIQVGYGNADVGKGNAIAGFLFVRDRAVERRQAATADDTQSGAFDEPGFYGNTYLLAGDQVQTVIDLATDERVTDGVLELHLSAGAGQAFDAQYIQVTALATEQPPTVVRQEVVQQVHDPYVYTYAYYYSGPWACAYPRTYVRYVFFDDALDPFFYGGWLTFRACFWNYHPWVYRPSFYTHWNGDDDRRGHYPSRPTPQHVTSYRDDWCRRNFHIDARQARDPVVMDSRVHRRSMIVQDEARRAEFQKQTRTIAETVRDTDRELKQSYGRGFAQKTQEWNRNPAAAERDLKPFRKKTPGLTKAAAALGSLPVKPAPALPANVRQTPPRRETKAVIPSGATATTPLPPSPPSRERTRATAPPAASARDTGTVQKPESKTLDDTRRQPPEDRGTSKTRGASSAASAAETTAPRKFSLPAAPSPAPTPPPTVPGDVIKRTPRIPATGQADIPDDKRQKISRPSAPPQVQAQSAPVVAPAPEAPAPRARVVPPPLPTPRRKVVSPPAPAPAPADVSPSATVVGPEGITDPSDPSPQATKDKRDKRRDRERDER